MSQAPEAFSVDLNYDRQHASDGVSRYAAYLRDAAFEPWTDDDQAVEWAVFAWERATGPVMSPGYVRYHPQVLTAQLARSGWDGGLAAVVTLVSAWPEQLATALVPAVGLGDRDVYWQDWPTEYAGGGGTCCYQPSEADVAARPYLLTTVSLQFTVPSAALPKPPGTPAAVLSVGHEDVVLAELNRVVGPVLAAVLGEASPRRGSTG